jgi:hypothetical protein
VAAFVLSIVMHDSAFGLGSGQVWCIRYWTDTRAAVVHTVLDGYQGSCMGFEGIGVISILQRELCASPELGEESPYEAVPGAVVGWSWERHHSRLSIYS